LADETLPDLERPVPRTRCTSLARTPRRYDGRSVILTSDTHGPRAVHAHPPSVDVPVIVDRARSHASKRQGSRHGDTETDTDTHNTLPLTLSVPDLGQGSVDYARKLTLWIPKRSSDPSRRTWGDLEDHDASPSFDVTPASPKK
jgi:hypothetical protein